MNLSKDKLTDFIKISAPFEGEIPNMVHVPCSPLTDTIILLEL